MLLAISQIRLAHSIAIVVRGGMALVAACSAATRLYGSSLGWGDLPCRLRAQIVQLVGLPEVQVLMCGGEAAEILKAAGTDRLGNLMFASCAWGASVLSRLGDSDAADVLLAVGAKKAACLLKASSSFTAARALAVMCTSDAAAILRSDALARCPLANVDVAAASEEWVCPDKRKCPRRSLSRSWTGHCSVRMNRTRAAEILASMCRSKVSKLLGDMCVAEVCEILPQLEREILDDLFAGRFLAEMTAKETAQILSSVEGQVAAMTIADMAMEDAVQVVSAMHSWQAAAILAEMGCEFAAVVLQELPQDGVVCAVLMEMEERDAALILARFESERARMIMWDCVRDSAWSRGNPNSYALPNQLNSSHGSFNSLGVRLWSDPDIGSDSSLESPDSSKSGESSDASFDQSIGSDSESSTSESNGEDSKAHRWFKRRRLDDFYQLQKVA